MLRSSFLGLGDTKGFELVLQSMVMVRNMLRLFRLDALEHATDQGWEHAAVLPATGMSNLPGYRTMQAGTLLRYSEVLRIVSGLLRFVEKWWKDAACRNKKDCFAPPHNSPHEPKSIIASRDRRNERP